MKPMSRSTSTTNTAITLYTMKTEGKENLWERREDWFSYPRRNCSLEIGKFLQIALTKKSEMISISCYVDGKKQLDSYHKLQSYSGFKLQCMC